jgi:cytochrome o ubiquinol oxidase subunit 2
MRRIYIAPLFLFVTIFLGTVYVLLRNYTFELFEPAGLIANEERGLMIHAVLLMLIVIIPVFILAFSIAWHYRASNTEAVYTPTWENSAMEELIWWAIPLEIVLVLGALTWQSTHQLDPKKPLTSTEPPLVVQVVALDWKWLFIYPSLGVASLNQLEIPVGRPIEFDITADAPMNSFWIPQLGGQIYAMTGMVNKLNLIADKQGVYRGGSANYSGDGFAAMQFTATAESPAQFDAWVQSAKLSNEHLTNATYDTYALPGTSTPVTFGSVEDNLYNKVVAKFIQEDMQTDTGAMNH